MTDIEKARQLFRDAGLGFPTITEGTRGTGEGAGSVAFLDSAD
jgi:hypothetical protein